MSSKPVALLIRHPLSGGKLQRLWEEAYSKALRNRFDLVVIEEDCDLDAICDRTKPALIAFRGAFSAPHRRIRVENAHCHAGIPRVGFYFGDGFCTSRPAFFYDMENWGVDTFFARTFYFSECTPEAVGRTFVLPQLFNEDVFRDYAENKTTPFIVFGAFEAWRPWRGETATALTKRYPTMVCPHPGYLNSSSVGISWTGEAYARALNRSLFSICDGSIFNCVLLKHVEIPACGAILVSQPIDGLKEYGFVDMENCVIGEGSALMSKIGTLVGDPDRLQRVARAGHDLAHARHATRHCDQLYRWFLHRRALEPGETIVQHGTFGDFEIVRDGRSGAIRSFPVQTNELTTLYEEAEETYRVGAYSICQKKLRRILDLKLEHAPARLLLVRAFLMAGRVQEATAHSRFIYNFAKQADQAPEPDPVEWAWWIVIQLCRGNLSEARTALAALPQLRHLELRRVAWLLDMLEGNHSPSPEGHKRDDRLSVATSLQPSLSSWLTEIEAMLRNCGQSLFAGSISARPG